MNHLNNGLICVTVDPLRGGSIMHLGATSDDDDNLLARYAWESPVPPLGGYESSKQNWLSRYQGGWQLLTPNAGAESTVNDVNHPFHGEVSTAAWEVLEHSHRTLTMRTATRGPLNITRILTLHPDRPRLTATTVLSNTTQVAARAIHVEHIAFANDDETTVEAPSRSEWEFDPASPESTGGRMVWETSPISRQVKHGQWRVATLVTGNEGWIELHRRNTIVRVTWDPGQLPFLWYWQERGTAQFPFFGRADITGLEPSSASFSDGLASAIDRNEAWTIAGGQEMTTSIAVELLTERIANRQLG